MATLFATPATWADDEQPAADTPPTDQAAGEADRAATAAFRGDVEPLMQRFCVDCHSGDEPAGEMSLPEVLKRASVAEDRETWDTIARRIRSGEMPPDDGEQPEPDQRDAIQAWIDGELERNGCGGARRPGRVTIRRLNRNEYNNTVRDLLGIDFKPADEFPSDDVGYGFDNIGDVLSMPPILLEKYLAAAEDIVERALGTNLTNGIRRPLEGGKDLGDGLRILTSTGEIRALMRTRGDGHYILRVRAYGDQAGDEPVRMGVFYNGEPIREFEVRATKDNPERYEVWIESTWARHLYSIKFLNDYYRPDEPGPNDRNLYVSDFEVMGPYPPSYKTIVPREHTPENRMLVAREVVNRFMRRAFRRPSTAAEVDRVLKLFSLADADGENFANAIGLAVQAMLVSPHFLFRVELDPPADDEDAIRELNDYEVATRLSYFLWSSMPDDELFALAYEGSLREPDNLARQVRRMLADPKSRALVDNFAGQWLQLRNLTTATPDAGVYPGFDDALRAAMRTETEMFFETILREDRSVLEFLDADFTFVNGRLAKHYGIDDIEGDEFRRVPLDQARRGGVLGHASVLTVTSNPTRTSPVKRGKWVLENLLGTPPPPPPEEVPPLEDVQLSGSLRQRMEQHRDNPVCASCHKLMDPLGFGLENYDGIGAWRDKDGEFDIDASGELPNGQTFAGPGELKKVLQQRQDDFLRCLAEKMLTYGLGRGVEYSDRCTVQDIAQAMADNQYKFSSLIIAVVTSDAFLKREGKGSSP